LINVLVGSLVLDFWRGLRITSDLRAKTVGTWHEDEIIDVLVHVTCMELHVLEVFDNLVHIGMISLTSELENFVDICFSFVESTKVLVLLPNVNLNFKIFL
jgi:hypothetical protein